KEIFDHVGIVDTDYYRQILEDLRKLGILESKVSLVEAQKMRLRKGVSKKSIPRFQIIPPSDRDQNNSPSQEQEEKKDRSDYAKIFVAGVDWFATESELEEVLSQFGDISDITIPRNSYSGKSKGFAFVEF